jgi:hypothetical protein
MRTLPGACLNEMDRTGLDRETGRLVVNALVLCATEVAMVR